MDQGHILDRALAHHEAGHQVIAHALGVSVRGVELSDGAGRAYDGLRFRRYFPELMSRSDWRDFRTKALILVAGEAAERVFYEVEGLPAPPTLWSRADREELRLHLAQVFGDAAPPSEYTIENMLQEVDRIIVRSWRQLVRVAEAAATCKKLSGSEVRMLLRPSGIVWEEER